MSTEKASKIEKISLRFVFCFFLVTLLFQRFSRSLQKFSSFLFLVEGFFQDFRKFVLYVFPISAHKNRTSVLFLTECSAGTFDEKICRSKKTLEGLFCFAAFYCLVSGKFFFLARRKRKMPHRMPPMLTSCATRRDPSIRLSVLSPSTKNRTMP